MSDDDSSLYDRWSTGDATAGNELFRRHYKPLSRFFRNNVDGDVADLVQETFLACLRNQFRGDSSFRTYLFGIARHTLYGHWRKRTKPEVEIDQVSVASLSTSAGTRIDRGGDRARLLSALRELPLEVQLMLELFYWQDIDGKELAEVFEIAPDTIRSRLFRARQTLREHLDQHTANWSTQASDGDFDEWARTLRPWSTATPPGSEKFRNARRASDTSEE